MVSLQWSLTDHASSDFKPVNQNSPKNDWTSIMKQYYSQMQSLAATLYTCWSLRRRYKYSFCPTVSALLSPHKAYRYPLVSKPSKYRALPLWAKLWDRAGGGEPPEHLPIVAMSETLRLTLLQGGRYRRPFDSKSRRNIILKKRRVSTSLRMTKQLK